VNFHVDKGEFVYIIGKVGSGKSSLLKSIYLELDIDEAEKAEIFDENICNIKSRNIPTLRRQMGIIFQDFQLLSDRTVRKNLKFVLKATGWDDKELINERIEEVLTEVGMLEKADKMPHELSGGEQQRVAIARAMLNNPQLIVADEPTGNLDPETAVAIIKLLRNIVDNGASVVMSTHNINIIEQYPGIVYRCNDGKIENVTETFNSPTIDTEKLNTDETTSDNDFDTITF
jgi:cell division transport system ATP-binding protein